MSVSVGCKLLRPFTGFALSILLSVSVVDVSLDVCQRFSVSLNDSK